MEHSPNMDYPWGLDDYTLCSEIWQRVSPGSHPYPETGEALSPPLTAPPSAPVAGESRDTAPGLEELALREQLLARRAMALSRRIPHRDTAHRLCSMGKASREAAEKLAAAVFLSTGSALWGGYIRSDTEGPLPLPDALRSLYGQEVFQSQRCRQAAAAQGDPCLRDLLLEISAAASRNGRTLLEAAGRLLCKSN